LNVPNFKSGKTFYIKNLYAGTLTNTDTGVYAVLKTSNFLHGKSLYPRNTALVASGHFVTDKIWSTG
jgi:hypothetical protein